MIITLGGNAELEFLDLFSEGIILVSCLQKKKLENISNLSAGEKVLI